MTVTPTLPVQPPSTSAAAETDAATRTRNGGRFEETLTRVTGRGRRSHDPRPSRAGTGTPDVTAPGDAKDGAPQAPSDPRAAAPDPAPGCVPSLVAGTAGLVAPTPPQTAGRVAGPASTPPRGDSADTRSGDPGAAPLGLPAAPAPAVAVAVAVRDPGAEPAPGPAAATPFPAPVTAPGQPVAHSATGDTRPADAPRPTTAPVPVPVPAVNAAPGLAALAGGQAPDEPPRAQVVPLPGVARIRPPAAPSARRTAAGPEEIGRRPTSGAAEPAPATPAGPAAALPAVPATAAGPAAPLPAAPGAPAADAAPPPSAVPAAPVAPAPTVSVVTGPPANPAAADPSPVQPATVPDQVLRHLMSVRALREGGHRTVLRLEPDHLGAVTVTVDVRAGAVRMAVSGGSQALAAVREGLGHLRIALADAGLDLGDVALRPDAGVAAPLPGSATPTPDGQNASTAARQHAGAGTGGDGAQPRRQGAAPPSMPSVPEPAPASRAASVAASPTDEVVVPVRRLDVRV